MDIHPKYEIDPDLFQRDGAQLLTCLTRHFRSLKGAAIKPSFRPGELAAQFSAQAPDTAKDFSELIERLESKIMPGLTHWQHPRFFSYYPAASSLPAILSELVIAAIGSVGLQWSANPIATELECVVMDWIAQMIHAPATSPFLHSSGKGGGMIQNTAGDALVAVMVAARIHKHLQLSGKNSLIELQPEQKEAIFYQDSSKFVIYMSDQTHFSGPKAARVAGLRTRILPASKLEDGNYGITANQVSLAMEEDRKKGLIPCGLQLNYGSTNTCGYDDIKSFQGFSRKEQIWIHVDAAYAGASLILPQFKERSLLIQELANSFNFNGSKWFLCGFDSAFLYIRDRRLFKEVFSASGAYLDTVESEETYNPEFKDWAIPLGRRFRSLRIWMVIEYFGLKGLQNYLQNTIDQGNWLREQVKASQRFELPVKTDLGLVCFKLKAPSSRPLEDLVRHLQTVQNGGGPFLVYPSQLCGEAIIRVALGGVNTKMEDVKSFWQECENWSS